MGPIGSGKSTGCAWEMYRRMAEQSPGADGKRRSRWAVVRNTYRELADTTVKTWLDWFPEQFTGKFIAQDMAHYFSYGDIEAEILFRALDRPQDVKKLLSLELTGAWINEAREVPKSVIDMIQGRVGRYPSKREGGPTWFGVIMDTNPPDNDHWWYRIFEEDKPEGFELYRQPSGIGPDAENVENLPDGYYTRMMNGKDQEWVKVYIVGEYGFLADGRPIYPEYKDSVHCKPFEVIPGDIYIGIDFGLTPAAVFAQRAASGQWRWLHEVVTEDMGAVRFAELLKREMNKFPVHQFILYGDPAGEQRAQTDERTPFDILRVNGLMCLPAPSNDFTLRREAVAQPLSRLIDGEPGLVIHPDCKQVRKGMSGGYNYKRIQVSGDERYHDKPDKNRYSHCCEAGQYLMLGAGENVVIKHRFSGKLGHPRVSVA